MFVECWNCWTATFWISVKLEVWRASFIHVWHVNFEWKISWTTHWSNLDIAIWCWKIEWVISKFQLQEASGPGCLGIEYCHDSNHKTNRMIHIWWMSYAGILNDRNKSIYEKIELKISEQYDWRQSTRVYVTHDFQRFIFQRIIDYSKQWQVNWATTGIHSSSWIFWRFWISAHLNRQKSDEETP